MTVQRPVRHPLIGPEDIVPSSPRMEVIGVFNAGAARLGDEIILLLRVAERPVQRDPAVYLTPIYDEARDEIVLRGIPFAPENDFSDPRIIRTPEGDYLTSISHFRVARSRDGLRFQAEERPTVLPATRYETFGIEDPRITQLDDGYYVAYSGVSPLGIVVGLLHTEDFRAFERRGLLFHPDNKDVAIFPDRIGGRYYALHRPSCSHFGDLDVWLAESPDLLCWGGHRHVMGVRRGEWDGVRIGASAVPLRTERGWLEIYHGGDAGNRYCLGAALLDLQEPWKVIARSRTPLLEPELPFETEGFFGNVVFSCGALLEDGVVRIYYGASDTSIGYAETTLERIWEHLEANG